MPALLAGRRPRRINLPTTRRVDYAISAKTRGKPTALWGRESGGPCKVVGRRLAKQGPVPYGEAPKFPEPKSCGNFGDGPGDQIGFAQGSSRQTHMPQQQVSLRTHSQLLLTAVLQGPFRHADRRAEVRDVERSVGMCLHRDAEPAQDRFVATLCSGVLPIVPLAETGD